MEIELVNLVAQATPDASFLGVHWDLFLQQLINGIQLGMLLFLLAAGLTLVFGIMDLVNLAHGSMYMVGAFVTATFTLLTDSFFIGLLIAVPATVLVGIATEVTTLRTLYARHHLDQVLATFGLILFFDETVRIFWGSAGMEVPLPAFLSGNMNEWIAGLDLPTYRVLIIAICLAVAAGLYWVVARTRLGMLIRAGATNREMIGALGVDIKLLYTLVFGLGAGLAGLAGAMAAPILSAQIGMGEQILIMTFVVIVVGGIGSIRGAFIGAMLVGVIDTMGRSFIDDLLLPVLSFASTDLGWPGSASEVSQVAETAAPAISSMLIYIIMATVLVFRPQGLFPPRG